MDIYSAIGLARAASQYAIKHVALTPQSLYSNLTPVCHFGTITNNDLKGPDVRTRDNQAYAQWTSMMSLHSLDGIRLWLQIAHKIQKSGFSIFVISDWLVFFDIIKQGFPYLSIAQMDIPIIVVNGNASTIRMTVLTEYLQMYPYKTPADFFTDIITFVLFGFIVDYPQIIALRLENEIYSYVLSRLKGSTFLSLAIPNNVHKRPHEQMMEHHSTKRQRY